jgi:DNA integrity scanning protein DisA with diadenylate cyclase activity
MKRTNQSILNAAFRIAKSSKAKALFVSLDSLNQVPEETPPKGCSLILVTRKTPDELEGFFPDGRASLNPLIQLPRIDMTRMGQVKMSVVLALSTKLIQMGDKIVFVTGIPEAERLDAILLLDTAKESEVLTTQGVNGISESVNPEVFEETLGIALELAARGREGKPVGTIFVLGDEEKVMQLSKQMIINPFKGYTDEERNILNPNLKETIREFAALDGAFVISSDGLVLTAGRYLGAASDESTIPRGLGSRHIAAAGITALTQAIAIVISESTGDVRIFKNGKILMEIEKPIKIPTNQ